MSSSSHDTVARTNEFEVTTQVRGPFLLVVLQGRFTDALLEILQKQIFLQLRSMAVDASGLSGITMALARSLYYSSQSLKSQGHYMVLVNPPDSFRGFLKLLGATGRMPILLSDSQLPAKAADVVTVSERLDRELQQLRRELETNVLWQFTDREYYWVCPFCGELRDDVRIPSRVQIGQMAIDRAWRHLHIDCRKYTPASPRYVPREELQAKVRESNESKLAASKGRVEALQSQVTQMQEKTQWAETLEKGVKIAASRQRKLLPTRAPDVPGCDIAYTYRPAEEVSGDFYDFVEMGDGRVAFVIGDVSGHGIEAGILMGMTKKVLSIRLSETADAVTAVKKTNADIVKDMDRSSFVTVCAIIYDPKTRSLSCARAGHNPPIIYNPAWGETYRRFENGGLMIGMAQPAIFDAQLVGEESTVQPGDILLLYTDGIEEGKNDQGEEFGIARMIPVIQAEATKPAAYLLGALFYEFDRFAGSVTQEDDLTTLCVKFT